MNQTIEALETILHCLEGRESSCATCRSMLRRTIDNLKGECKPPTNPHCWTDGPETDDGCSTTCMLMHGHEGPHEWTRDDGIEVTFESKDEVSP